MTDKPLVYLDTSFISYLAARPSRDVVTAQRQLVSQQWWQLQRENFSLRVSPAVFTECTSGDPISAQRRLAYLNDIVVLPPAPDIVSLQTQLIVPNGPIPLKAADDALHLATAAFYGCNYLLTWNFTHLANAIMRPKVDNTIRNQGYEPAYVCTAEELSAESPG